jgi:PAS domain S-box-containing protein
MPQSSSDKAHEFDRVLRDLVTKREFSQLSFDAALLYFCKVLSTNLNAPRVGVWGLNEENDVLSSMLLWSKDSGRDNSKTTLTVDDAKSYLDAVASDFVVSISDARNDPRCVELAKEYLPNTNVSALLDCPIRTFGGLAGVVCIEDLGQPRVWTTDETNFALAIAGLVSLTIEHNERNLAEKSAKDQETRLKTYTELATDWFWETGEDFTLQILHGNTANDGQMPTDYVGRKLWEVPTLSPHSGTWEGLRSRITARKRIYDFVVAATDAAGDTYYVELAGMPKYASDGTYEGYWGTTKDVTSRVRQAVKLSESEQKYRTASRIAKLGSWTWDQIEDACTYCSPELAEIYGVTVEEYLARTSSTDRDLEWFHPDDLEHYRRIISTAARNKTGYEAIVRIVRDDGSVRTLHEQTEAVFDSSGHFIATAGVLQDITENVELRSNLKDHQDRLKGIVDNIPGTVYRVKYDGKFTNVYRSDGFLRQFVDPDMMLPVPNDDPNMPSLNVRESDRERIDTLLRRSVVLKQPYEIEYLVTLADGSEKWISDSGRPVANAQGGVELEGIMIDVTEKHAAQDALAHGQRLEAIGKLTGGMAHDFNNLLAVVLGNMELLRDELSLSAQLRLVDAAIDAVERGADLTKNMLAFARESKLNLERIDLNDLARKGKNWIGRTLPENITVETSLLAGLWTIETDSSSTESAILNLILNARDAMPEGGKLTLETSNVRVDEDYVQSRHEDIEPGRYVMLAVSDTGHGIPKDVLESIFEPFFTTKPPGAGSGLGLSMILGFMKQSGGSVRVYSEPGIGTTFKLYFRALNSDAAAQAPISDNKLTHSSGSARILVVEDEPPVLEVLKVILAKAGYDIRTASSGDEAQAIFETDQAFDLLLTDIVMPGVLQGTHLAKALRESFPELRVVFMSGYASEATVHGNGLRPEDIRLMKPVSRTDLIRAIEKALAK